MSADCVICIDGAAALGWARWARLDWDNDGPPLEVGVIESGMQKWQDRVEDVCKQLGKVVARRLTSDAFLEYPALFEGSGMVAAREGSLVKLAFCIGALTEVCWAFGVECTLVPVNEWKGQTKKEHTIRRVKMRLGEKKCEQLGIKTHAWDAVGIGLYIQGRL